MIPSANRQLLSGVRAYGQWPAAQIQPVPQPAGPRSGKEKHSGRNSPCPAAILMHASPYIERIGIQIFAGSATRDAPHDHIIAPLHGDAIQAGKSLRRRSRTSERPIDCSTMRSDVMGDFQEPQGAIFIRFLSVHEVCLRRCSFTSRGNPLASGQTVPQLLSTVSQTTQYRETAVSPDGPLPGVDESRFCNPDNTQSRNSEIFLLNLTNPRATAQKVSDSERCPMPSTA